MPSAPTGLDESNALARFRRFRRDGAIALAALSCLLGAMTAFQATFAVDSAGNLEAMLPQLFRSAVRSLAPGAVGSALVIALVLWGQATERSRLPVELSSLIRRVLPLVLAGYVLALAAVAVSGVGVGYFAFGSDRTSLSKIAAALGPSDFAAGMVATLLDAGLIALLAFRLLAPLIASGSSLPAKLAIAWTASVALRAMLAAIVTAALPG